MNSTILKEKLINGSYNDHLASIYVLKTSEEIQKEVNRYLEAIKSFEDLYGVSDIAIYSAPGRTEVGGNHTDHQHGKVLAAAVNMDALAIVSKNSDNYVKLESQGYKVAPINLEDLAVVEAEKFTTESLIRGTCAKFKADGYNIGGFNAFCTSSVLKGSGISSSAAFEVLIGVILNNEYNNGVIDPIKIAQIAQYSENVYFGKPCGLMDQMASSVGGFVNIDFRDIANPVVKQVNFDIASSGYALCLVDTGGNHADLSDEYGLMVSEMKDVARVFGKNFLIEVDPEEFYENIAKVRSSCSDRAVLRAIHFFADDARVNELVKDLEKKDIESFFKAVKESGRSSYMYLQNVFCVKTPHEQGLSIGLALSERILKDRGAYRVHGGGLAGTIQAYVPNDLVAEYKATLEKVFSEGSCHILAIRPFGGIKVI